MLTGVEKLSFYFAKSMYIIVTPT